MKNPVETFRYVAVVLLLFVMAACQKSVSDDQLTKDVQAKLQADPTTQTAQITVAVKDAVVTLSGTIASSDIDQEAVKVANGVTGVKSVTDQMQVNAAAAEQAPAPAPAGQEAAAPAQPGAAPSQQEQAALPATPVSYSAPPQDPPARVARLNYMQGNVSMEPAGTNDWAPAVLNRPFTTGDYLYTDSGARAELHLDIAVLRLGAQTSFGFLNLNDQVAQIKLTEGEMCFHIRNFASGQTFEVDTPNGAVNLLQNGKYQISVDPNRNSSLVVVRQGQAQVTGNSQPFLLNAGSAANLSSTGQYDIEGAPGANELEDWCSQRDNHEMNLKSAQYLPPTTIGYEDLDDYGDWQPAPNYGPVWYPRQVESGWAPYHNGHWAWVEPWGWTWVDDRPWGFAPFHYGRWAYVNNRWGWCPGPMAVGARGPAVRPYYAPAMVAWFGGQHWGVGISVGGPSLGWVSLGFGEVYTPSYHCSPRYFQNVNVYNTTVVRTVNITNVYNTVYVNHAVYNQAFINSRAPNAVLAMPQSAFATGRPVAQVARVVPEAQVMNNIRVSVVVAPSVVPTQQAVIPTLGRSAPHPAAQIFQRTVIVRSSPPPPPASFAARQQYLQQHAGQVHDFAAMHQAVAPQVRQAADLRQAPAGRPVVARPGQHFGPAIASARPAAATPAGRPAPAMPAARTEARPGAPASRAETPAARPEARPGAPNARPETRAGEPAARTEGARPQPRTAERPASQPAAREVRPAATPAARPENRPAPRTEAPAARPEAKPAARSTAPARPEERKQAPAQRPEHPENAKKKTTSPEHP